MEKLRSSFDDSKSGKNRGVIDAIISGTGFAKAFGLDEDGAQSTSQHAEAKAAPHQDADAERHQDDSGKRHDDAQQ